MHTYDRCYLAIIGDNSVSRQRARLDDKFRRGVNNKRRKGKVTGTVEMVSMR